ncbi:TetR/AcrR family transcriptional regulator [Paenibacillus thiaminolyticus]|uniref:TetR/AcrR family transcriptional regulator n=1 Tax=Paenibacillus thiaminolyticus TaxID=49283 RepID=UPI00232C7ECE|nr:TetR/AcrR family transcriptional regulator [Paenibacillus thiaminolyticus]WCF09121.1 TetR/AcrR family transcriptional regulator [Paenibacillus thiaminolyticus]WII38368.1 helix-turn-helix domain containing protein [Paenibacillus thiaminolyticus]
MAKGKAEAILETGERLFFERGIQETSMEQIAEAVPVAKMTIYKYFQSKEGLLEAIIDRLMDESFQLMQTVMSEAKDIRDLFERLMNYRDFDQISPLFISDLVEYYPAIFAKLMSYQENRVIPVFEEALFRAQQAGQVRKDLSPHLMVLYIMSMKEFMSQPGRLEGGFGLRTLAEQLMTMLCHGILTDRDVKQGE